MERSSSAVELNRQASFTSNFALTDIYRDRLPSASPYVGTFHRGHTVSDADCPTFDVKEDRLLKSCPYIGVFNHSKRSPLAAAAAVAAGGGGAERNADKGAVLRHDTSCHEHDIRSQASTPPSAPRADGAAQMVIDKLERRENRSLSLGEREPVAAAESGSGLRRVPKKTKIARHRSWADLTQFTKQQTPELCGLQAILPKGSGVRIIDKLGEGTFAKVVLALNKRNSGDWRNRGVYRRLVALPKEGEKLVLKCVRKEQDMGCDGLECLQREVAIHSQLSHPNVPTMYRYTPYGFYDDGRNVTMILDYIEGQELKELMNTERTLPEGRALLIMLQTLRALAYVHAAGFAHRDISPRNVLVNSSDKAFLIDFGLAVTADNDDEASAAPDAHGGHVGTMGYVAPEAMRGRPSCAKSDVWGLGCILYEMVFGFSPFLPHEVLSGEAVPFPDPSWGMDASAPVQDLIAKMLDKDASSRLSAAAALALPAFAPALHAAADELCEGDRQRRAEERAACPPNDSPAVPPPSPSTRRQLGAEGPGSYLAVNLETPLCLTSQAGDHSNFLATVLLRGGSGSIEEEEN